jgi:5-methylcytosine-specific restriction endonuclease McrA
MVTRKSCLDCGGETRTPLARLCDSCRLVRNRNNRSKWHKDHPGYATRYSKKWRLANPEKHSAYLIKNADKLRLKQAARRAANRERVDVASLAWAKANPERKRLAAQRRRARLRDASSPGVELDTWLHLCAIHDDRCAYCDEIKPLTIDHVVPISRGGRDEAANIVPACKPCNSSKGNRLLSEWRGRLSAAA